MASRSTDRPEDLKRTLTPRTRGADPCLELNGRRLVNFTANNYLSLASHPAVIEAAVAAVREDGAGAGSSRLISGTSPRLVALEEELAVLKGAERALVTTSGYTAALAAITTLVGRGDGIALEKGAHACLVAGARLSGARLAVFRQGEPETLGRALKQLHRKAQRLLVILDGIHSMDGDLAPLSVLLPLIERHGALALIDDAHATGVIGVTGAGTLEHHQLPPRPHLVQMGTLSKALGSQGGFIAASAEIIGRMIQGASAFIYTTGLNPAAVGAAREALAILRREPERRRRLELNARALRRGLGAEDSASPIVPVILGDAGAALAAAARLADQGVLVPAIRPPTVPRGTARLRFSVQADHDPADLERAAATLAQIRAGTTG